MGTQYLLNEHNGFFWRVCSGSSNPQKFWRGLTCLPSQGESLELWTPGPVLLDPQGRSAPLGRLQGAPVGKGGILTRTGTTCPWWGTATSCHFSFRAPSAQSPLAFSRGQRWRPQWATELCPAGRQAGHRAGTWEAEPGAAGSEVKGPTTPTVREGGAVSSVQPGGRQWW